MTKTLVYSLSKVEPQVKSSTGNYEVSSLQVGDEQRPTVGDRFWSKWDKNAVCTIIKIRTSGKKPISIRWDNGRVVHCSEKFFEDMTRCSPSLTCVVAWVQDSQPQESLLEDSSCEDFAKLTNSAVTDSLSASQVSESTPTCENSGLNREPQISSPLHHHAPHSQLKVNVWEVPTPETASPPSYDKSDSFNPSLQLSKTCLDCYQLPLFPQTNPAHILGRCSGSFGQMGTMRNGLLSEQPSLELSGQEKGSCLLPRPGALSWSGNGRPPGTTKSEAAAKKLGIIQKNEVFNPEWLEVQFGLPVGWTSPQEHRAATALLERKEPPSEIVLTPDLQQLPSEESSTSTPSSFKAISLWQPWASLIPLGLKHYETRSWKTNYRGKLLICSTTSNPKHYQEYLKIKDQLQLPAWDETNFPHGRAIAICDLTDCIQMTAEFIEQQSETEILCGDWQVGRYAWKLENIQPITEPFAVKGKQGLFNIVVDKQWKELLNPVTDSHKPKSSDCWYTPPHIVDLVNRVLGEIDLDPCADDGRHIPSHLHYTAKDDGLKREWQGRVFMNPPYSCPGVWMNKLQSEVEAGRVVEAIALVPAATDTNWLSPVLKTQPVCFWKGRIKFLDVNYQPKLPARQSHCLVYWGENWQKFKEVFDSYGFVSVPNQFLEEKLDQQQSSRKEADNCKFLEDYSEQQQSSRNSTDDYQFLEDKNYSSRKEADNCKFLEDYSEQQKSSRNSTDDYQFLEDKNYSSRKEADNCEFLEDYSEQQKSSRNSTDDYQFLEDKNYSSRKTRRNRGEGSGCIYYRTVTKKGKEYCEAYYQYEFWSEGVSLTKSTKYIPKRLLAQVQQMEQDKAPVREILGVLGIVE